MAGLQGKAVACCVLVRQWSDAGEEKQWRKEDKREREAAAAAERGREREKDKGLILNLFSLPLIVFLIYIYKGVYKC